MVPRDAKVRHSQRLQGDALAGGRLAARPPIDAPSIFLRQFSSPHHISHDGSARDVLRGRSQKSSALRD